MAVLLGWGIRTGVIEEVLRATVYKGVDELLHVEETRCVKLKEYSMVCSTEGRKPWGRDETSKAGQATQKDHGRFSAGDSASDGEYILEE